MVAGTATVAWAALVSLALANLGRFDGWVALVAGALLPLVVALVGWRRRDRLGALRWRWSDPVLVLVCAAITAVLLVPGFPYLLGDKDPGVYAGHALAIERTGDTAIADPVLERADEVPVQNYLDDRPLPARFPGFWVDPRDGEQVRPQFFHLLPATMALAASVGGTPAMFSLTPALAGLALLALALAVRLALGPAAAALAALYLGTNMLQVWHARHPSTEILVQLFIAGAALAVLLAVRWRATWAAAVAGALVAAAFLARPDGLLLVLLGLAVVALFAALGVGGRLPHGFLVGMGAGLPYPLYQAYYQNRTYLLANDLPDWPVVAGLAAAVAAGAVLVRRVVRPRVDGWSATLSRRLPGDDPRLVAAIGVGALTAALLVLAWFRPEVFDPVMATTMDGRRIPRLDEWNLRKLSWFVTVPGLVAMWAGFVLLVRRRSWAHLWFVVLPGTLLFPLFVWQARIESRLLWWGRRFVPVILPAMAVLMAAGVVAALVHRGRARVVTVPLGAVLAAYLVAVPVAQSWEVRDHREHGGSVELVDQVAALAGGDEALFLWEFPRDGDPFDPARVLGGPVWFVHGHVSALLPREPTSRHLVDYLRAFRDHRLFVVTRGEQPPAWMPGADTYEPALRVATDLAHWREEDFERPDGAVRIDLDFTVWELARWEVAVGTPLAGDGGERG